MRKTINAITLLLAVVSSSVCAPSLAGSDGFASTDPANSHAAAKLLGYMGKMTDFFSHIPFSDVIHGERSSVKYFQSAISLVGATRDGSFIRYYCGVMKEADGKLVRVPALDYIMIWKKLPSGETGHMFAMAAPDETNAAGATGYPQKSIAGISNGTTHYYQFTRRGERDTAQACESPHPGDSKTCRSIAPFFPGGMPIRLMEWGTRGCNDVVRRNVTDTGPFVVVGNKEANQALAARYDGYLKYTLAPASP